MVVSFEEETFVDGGYRLVKRSQVHILPGLYLALIEKHQLNLSKTLYFRMNISDS